MYKEFEMLDKRLELDTSMLNDLRHENVLSHYAGNVFKCLNLVHSTGEGLQRIEQNGG